MRISPVALPIPDHYGQDRGPHSPLRSGRGRTRQPVPVKVAAASRQVRRNDRHRLAGWPARSAFGLMPYEIGIDHFGGAPSTRPLPSSRFSSTLDAGADRTGPVPDVPLRAVQHRIVASKPTEFDKGAVFLGKSGFKQKIGCVRQRYFLVDIDLG